MSDVIDDTQGLEDALTTLWHAANLTPYDDESIVDVVGPSVEEAKQAILHWVNTEVISAGDPMSTMADAQVYRGLIRAKQRQILIHHGYKQNTKEVTE